MKSRSKESKHKDWELVRLGDNATFLKKLSLSRDQMTPGGEVSYLHYGDIHVGPRYRLNAKTEPMPTIKSTDQGNAVLLAVGDLVFVDASEDAAGIGKSVELTDVPPGGVVAGLHTIAVRFDKSLLADGFKAYLQEIPAFRSHMIRLAAGTKVLASTKAHIASAELLLPSPDEQKVIAKALCDTDSLIDSLDALIAKKRDIKQGAMQQLLTSKTRLPGFSGEWALLLLSELVRFQNGYSFSSKDYRQKGHQLIRISNVQNGKIVLADPIFVDVPQDTRFQQYILSESDILISLTGNVGRVAKMQLDHLPAALNQRVSKIAPKNLLNLSNDFLYHALRSDVFLNFVIGSGEGAAQQNTSNAAIGKFPMRLPPSLREQQAIAEVLSDMDAEIDALVARRDKTALIKTGMMQELLTGRTRLI